jgi:hypothetical protein
MIMKIHHDKFAITLTWNEMVDLYRTLEGHNDKLRRQISTAMYASLDPVQILHEYGCDRTTYLNRVLGGGIQC